MSDPDYEKITLEDLEKIFDVPFVLWTCPNDCRGYVEWDKDSTLAKCLTCGKTSEGKFLNKENNHE